MSIGNPLGSLLESANPGYELGYLDRSLSGMILGNPPGSLSISSDSISQGALLGSCTGYIPGI